MSKLELHHSSRTRVATKLPVGYSASGIKAA